MIAQTMHACLLLRFSLPVELRYLVVCYTVRKLNNVSIRKAVKDYRSSEVLCLFGPMEWWDTSCVTTMRRLFNVLEVPFDDRKEYMVNMAQVDISNWDVSNVTDMSFMFGFSSFNSPIGKWNVSNVRNMQELFCGATQFNQPLEEWNVSNVENMSWMFSSANKFNQPLGNWDVSKVEDMQSMFSKASDFNQPLGNWNVSNVNNMERMFSRAVVFNQPLGKWNVSSVTNMTLMFHEASAFNQSINQWKFPETKRVKYLLEKAKSFKQKLTGDWHEHRSMLTYTYDYHLEFLLIQVAPICCVFFCLAFVDYIFGTNLLKRRNDDMF